MAAEEARALVALALLLRAVLHRELLLLLRLLAGGAAGKQPEEKEKLSMKDRTKEKRKRDQSAGFLGGHWKSDEEMRMRDNFDS